MNIPLVNLQKQYQSIKKEVDAAIRKICIKSNFVLGEEVDVFEKQFAKYIGVTYCVGVASGTDAIKLMLLAAGVGPGDEVITQANTFISTVLPIIELGAKPILVDCDNFGVIDVGQVKAAITKRTKAILPVHLFGYPSKMKELALLVRRHRNILLLEDAAQAQGSSLHGKRCGSFGAMAAFSFYPGKNLGAYGDGGAITTNNSTFASKLQILRNIGQKEKYKHVVLGTNSRLDTIQAAVLSVKLKYLNRWNKKRDVIARRLVKELSGLDGLSLPPLPARRILQNNWHLFVIQAKKRDRLTEFLDRNGIHWGIHYPMPLHLTPALKFLGYKKGDFPLSEMRARTMISLPMFAELAESEIAYIISKIRSFYRT